MRYLVFILTLGFLVACGQVSQDPDLNTSADKQVKLKASKDIIKNSGNGSQTWGESVSIAAFDLKGKAATLVYDTQFSDHGFGVEGARWKQIDYYEKEQGGPGGESVVIDFGGAAKNVVLTVGMMGLNEGGKGFSETGKWTAFDKAGKKIAQGLLGPELSTLGENKKASGSYGKYPIALKSGLTFYKIKIEATGFGHGTGEPKQKRYGENNSDFNIMELSFTRPGSTQPKPPTDPDPQPDPPAPENQKPQAKNDTGFSVVQDQVLTIAASKLLANDSDPDGDPLTIAVANDPQPQGSTVTLKNQGETVEFKPAAGFTGFSTFAYSITDGKGRFSTAIVGITVVEKVGNNPPVAKNDGPFNAVAGQRLSISFADLLANDSDPNGDAIKLKSVGKAFPAGSLIGLNNSQAFYTPPANFEGNGEFVYTIQDSKGLTSTAKVSIRITKPVTNPNPDQGQVVSLSTNDLNLDGSTRPQKWGASVEVAARSVSGSPAALEKRSNRFGVKGDRYGYQLDYNPELKQSEMIILKFAKPAKNVELSFYHMETSEWKGLPETGVWKAYNANGQQVASGVLDPTQVSGGSRPTFKLNSPSAISRIEITATAYGHGKGGDRFDNNSDFSLYKLKFTN